MSDPANLASAILAGRLPSEPFFAALPMYDWPEVRGAVDAQWEAVREELRKRGVHAPERLTRRNAGLPPVPGGIKDRSGKVIAPDPACLPPDEFDLAVLWRHPNLLLAQTCHGPLELWLKNVRVVGQEDYSGIEGGEGEMYSSALVMRRSEAPLSVLSDISPARGEMSDRTERGAWLQTLPSALRLAYNAPDSMSGYLALKRDLGAQGSGIDIFSELILTGGHRASIRAVAEGRADIAAIDCKTWEMARRFEPMARELIVVRWTGRRKGLPFVTAAH